MDSILSVGDHLSKNLGTPHTEVATCRMSSVVCAFASSSKAVFSATEVAATCFSVALWAGRAVTRLLIHRALATDASPVDGGCVRDFALGADVHIDLPR